MNKPADTATLLEPLTLSERVAIGEDFFRRYFTIALIATVLAAISSVIIALVDREHSPTGTIVVALAICVGVARALRPNGYNWLRRHRYALVLAGPLTAASSLWPAVDANAVYYPALAPLALIACVAQRRRERVAVIVSLSIGTAVAALLDEQSPQLSSVESLISATIGVPITGVLFGVAVDWCARRVLIAPNDLSTAAKAPPDVALPPAYDETPEHRERQRSQRINEISRASREQLIEQRPEQLAKLTARELQVLFLVAEGLNRHDVAACLAISPNTVDKHIEHVRSKTELVLTGRPTAWLTIHLPPFSSSPQPDRQLPM